MILAISISHHKISEYQVVIVGFMLCCASDVFITKFHMRSDLGIVALHSKICNVSQMLHDKLKLYKITSIQLQCSIF